MTLARPVGERGRLSTIWLHSF